MLTVVGHPMNGDWVRLQCHNLSFCLPINKLRHQYDNDIVDIVVN